MHYTARLNKYKDKEATLDFDKEVNTERLRTMYNNDIRNVDVEVKFVDPRKVRPKQRALFFALLNDILTATGTPQDFTKDYFYGKYQVLTYGESISIRNGTENTVSDANLLLEIVIDFMFEWNIPFAEGYELLPKNEEYYLYMCCKHRYCAICGKHADIHHATSFVGMGRNRKEIDHSQSGFAALCREHHNEAHNLGWTLFTKKYFIKAINLNNETLIRLGLTSKKRIDELERGDD